MSSYMTESGYIMLSSPYANPIGMTFLITLVQREGVGFTEMS
jgi:hypothetical protein